MADGISKADQLVQRAVNGDASVYCADHPATEKEKGASGGAGHKVYTQLMNGVSHMLPFVVGGGILIAIAFLIDGLSVDLNSLPADQRANFGTITPVAALFKGIGDTAFGFMLPVSTPQNAIVYGTGAVPITKMIRTGFSFDIAGAILIVILVPVMVGIVGLGQ